MKSRKLTEECITKEIIFEGKIISVRKDIVLLPDGKEGIRDRKSVV